MEIFELIKKAKTLSSIFEEKSNNKGDNQLSTESIVKMLKLINNIKEVSEKKDNIKSDNEIVKFNLDNSNIRSIKAVLPYIDTEYKNKMDIFINFMEINNLISKYRYTYNNLDIEQKPELKKNVLLYIKPQLDEKNKPMIDIFVKAIEINKILNSNYIKRGI